MPFEISHDKDYVVIRWLGTITALDLEDAARAVGRMEAADSASFHRVSDLTGIKSMDIAYPEILRLADHRRALKFATPIKTALVANQPLQIGYARMFQSLNDNASIEIRVFRSFDDASRWVCEG